MSAFIPASGLSNVSGTRVNRESVVSPLRRPTGNNNVTTTTPSMVSYPYTGSGYGGCGVPYANNKVGQLYTKTKYDDIVTTAASTGIFTKLIELLKSSGLDYELLKGGPFTVLAPTDNAFTKLLEPHSFSQYASLFRPDNSDQFTKILAYHIIPGEIYSANLKSFNGSITVTTLSGDKITLTLRNRFFSVGSSPVIRKDIPCSNGVIQIIDSLLTPPSYVTPPIYPEPLQLPDSIVKDVYGKMLTPRQALGIDPVPSDSDSDITPY